jgi:hypothetical protein
VERVGASRIARGSLQEGFVEKVAGRVSPAPTNHELIAGLNRSGRMPEEDFAEMEAGANRCAAG